MLATNGLHFHKLNYFPNSLVARLESDLKFLMSAKQNFYIEMSRNRAFMLYKRSKTKEKQ